MKLLQTAICFGLIFSFLLISCQKDLQNLSAKSHITLFYPRTTEDPNWELIIEGPNGKILDTLVPYGVNVEFDLPGDVDKVDLTSIAHYYSSNYIYTYKGVDIRTWNNPVLTCRFDYWLGITYPPKTVSYVNVPTNLQGSVNEPNSIYSNLAGYVWASTYSQNAITYNTWKVDGIGYNYIFFPQTAQYKLSPQGQGDDVVDLSAMDIAKPIEFNTSPGYSMYYGQLIGVFDSTNIKNSLTLYSSVLFSHVDKIFCPDINVQKYGLFVRTSNADSTELQTMYRYSDSIPRTVSSYESADYDIGFGYSDVFEVHFPRRRPSFYQLNLSGTNIYFVLQAPPDTSVVYPKNFLTDLQSKFLTEDQINSLELETFTMSNLDDMNYIQATNFGSQKREDRLFKTKSNYSLIRNFK